MSEQLCSALAGSWALCAIAEGFWVGLRSPVLGCRGFVVRLLVFKLTPYF